MYLKFLKIWIMLNQLIYMVIKLKVLTQIKNLINGVENYKQIGCYLKLLVMMMILV